MQRFVIALGCLLELLGAVTKPTLRTVELVGTNLIVVSFSSSYNRVTDIASARFTSDADFVLLIGKMGNCKMISCVNLIFVIAFSFPYLNL